MEYYYAAQAANRHHSPQSVTAAGAVNIPSTTSSVASSSQSPQPQPRSNRVSATSSLLSVDEQRQTQVQTPPIIPARSPLRPPTRAKSISISSISSIFNSNSNPSGVAGLGGSESRSHRRNNSASNSASSSKLSLRTNLPLTPRTTSRTTSRAGSTSRPGSGIRLSTTSGTTVGSSDSPRTPHTPIEGVLIEDLKERDFRERDTRDRNSFPSLDDLLAEPHSVSVSGVHGLGHPTLHNSDSYHRNNSNSTTTTDIPMPTAMHMPSSSDDSNYSALSDLSEATIMPGSLASSSSTFSMSFNTLDGLNSAENLALGFGRGYGASTSGKALPLTPRPDSPSSIGDDNGHELIDDPDFDPDFDFDEHSSGSSGRRRQRTYSTYEQEDGDRHLQHSRNSRSSKASSMLAAAPSLSTMVDKTTSSSSSSSLGTSTAIPPTPQALSSPAGLSGPASTGPLMTKRQYALHEMLSSERAYASDLVLIRDIHVPLALGLTIPLSNISLPASPPNSSGSSSRTLSTASDSSNDPNKANANSTSPVTPHPNNTNGGSPTTGQEETKPPMTPEDTKLIFSNIAEIALFSDMFTEEIEAALGKEVEGGVGDDRVGELFLRIAPELERLYKHYITRHPTALAHLNALPSTPALQSYLTYTQTIASSLSHAWDLASLLIKPVQRLLKYPLLLSAIIDETPDEHPDKERLVEARKRMEEVARNVNEGRRRAEVVKDVLSGGGGSGLGGSGKGSKKGSGAGGSGGSGGVGVGVAASVNLSKMKSLRHGGVTAATMRVSALSEGGNSEAVQVEAFQNELKRLDAFAQQFARAVVDWGRMTSNMMLGLRTWAASFGKVIGLSMDQSSEAFDAFVEVVQRTLLPLAVDLESVINERVLKDLAHLLGTMSKPFKLMRSMDEQEPYHYHLLTMPVSAKNRPPPALLEASQNYLALRGQLAAELPAYIALLHRGLAVLVRRLADIQVRFWRDVMERWGELWEMLRVDGELNAGWEETTAVWWGRWVDVDVCVAGLGVCKGVKESFGRWFKEKEEREKERELRERVEKEVMKEKEMRTMAAMMNTSMSFAGGIGGLGMVPPMVQQQQQPQGATPQKKSSRRSSGSGQQLGISVAANASMMSMQSGKATAVYNMMGALEPALSGRKERPTPLPLGSGGMMINPGMPSPPATMTSFPVSAPLPFGASQMYGHAKNRSRDLGEGGRGKRVSNEGVTSIQVGGVVKNVIRRLSSQDSMQATSREMQQGHVLTHVQRRSRDDTKGQQMRRTQGYGQAATMAEDFAEYMSQTYQQQQEGAKGGGHYAMPGGFEYPAAGPSTSGPTISPSSPQRPGIPRTKSMPLSDKATSATVTPGPAYASGPILPGGSPYYYEEDYADNAHSYSGPYQQQQTHPHRHELRRSGSSKQREGGSGSTLKERGRRPSEGKNQHQSGPAPVNVQVTTSTMTMADPSPPRRQSKSKEKSHLQENQSRERPTHARKRSGSVKSITSFFSSTRDSGPGSGSTQQEQTLTPSQRDSWVSKPAKYICRVVHPCKPPASVSYYSFPFFTLQEGDLYEVLQEAGHPSIHPKLPLYVDDGEDCLLLCRDERGTVGWALASFLEPVLGV